MEKEEMKRSILDMADGGIKEVVDFEVAKIVDNILDLNTVPTKKRSLVLTIDIAADDKRTTLIVSSTVKSKLVPVAPVVTSFYMTPDDDGVLTPVEMTKQTPGQLAINGTEQQQPKILKLTK